MTCFTKILQVVEEGQSSQDEICLDEPNNMKHTRPFIKKTWIDWDASSRLKGLSHQIRFAWKWYGSLGLDKDMWRWILKKFLTLQEKVNR
jgi:hypothetical protein